MHGCFNGIQLGSPGKPNFGVTQLTPLSTLPHKGGKLLPKLL